MTVHTQEEVVAFGETNGIVDFLKIGTSLRRADCLFRDGHVDL
jgi:hypothetical protein